MWFIDDHRDVCRVEPICRVIPTASPTCDAFRAREARQSLRSGGAKWVGELKPEVQHVWVKNLKAYGAEKGLPAAQPGNRSRGPSHSRAAHAGARVRRNGARWPVPRHGLDR